MNPTTPVDLQRKKTLYDSIVALRMLNPGFIQYGMTRAMGIRTYPKSYSSSDPNLFSSGLTTGVTLSSEIPWPDVKPEYCWSCWIQASRPARPRSCSSRSWRCSLMRYKVNIRSNVAIEAIWTPYFIVNEIPRGTRRMQENIIKKTLKCSQLSRKSVDWMSRWHIIDKRRFKIKDQ